MKKAPLLRSRFAKPRVCKDSLVALTIINLLIKNHCNGGDSLLILTPIGVLSKKNCNRVASQHTFRYLVVDYREPSNDGLEISLHMLG